MTQIFTTVLTLAKAYKWYLIATLVFAGGVYGYSIYQSDPNAEAQAFSVVQAVGRGDVSSGIETTGEIVAAQKLDLDVYKQLARIDIVNVQNGSHVEEGDVLVSFDKSDANVDARSSAVSVAEAELDLQTAQENASDPNTQIRTLEDQIAAYKKSISDAYIDFLNENIEAVPHPDKEEEMTDEGAKAPTISGTYVGIEQGEYYVKLYMSDDEWTYYAAGLGKTGPQKAYFNQALPLGSEGLKITFSEQPEESQTWLVAVPNVYAPGYAKAKADYEAEVRGLEVSLANAEQDLADLKQTDSSAYRDLDVEKAELTLSEARQKLSENYDAIQERNLVAPFAGSIQDMQNVVVGATPTGGTEDSISLGTLVSDEYLATFTLDAADVAKIKVGQKVNVTITSYANQPQFEATITEISSLPTSSGVAQYDVSAILSYDAETSETVLREGMLADIVVVQEEKEDALRVPTSAISYEGGKPTVKVVDALTEEQQQEFERLGIVRTDGTELATYPATVELGIEGRFYIEILSGLNEGDLILTTATTLQTSETTVQTGFGLPGGLNGGNRNFQGGGNDGGAPSGR